MAQPSRPVVEAPQEPSESPPVGAERDGQQTETPEALAAPEDFQPPAGELVVSDPDEVFSVLDKHDESQILDELQGRIMDASFYDFPKDGHRIVDLSYRGVREVVGLMNRTGKCRIRVIPGSMESSTIEENGEPHYRVLIWAEDAVTLAAYSGLSHEPKRMKLKPATAKKWRDKGKAVPDDNTVWDSFAETKALAKAERNALAKFIPETIRQTLIAQYRGDASMVKRIEMGADGGGEMAELPPPLLDDRADDLRATCRDLYERIKEADPEMRVKFPPGQFHLLMARSEWSHERLEEFVGHLRGLLEKARA